MTTIPLFRIKNLDLPLLLKQKLAVVRAIDHTQGEDKVLLEGVLNLLDHLHDKADPPSNSNSG
jgi:hypothetical protein